MYAKFNESLNGDFLNSQYQKCELIIGNDITTPQGKVKDTNLQGFIKVESLSDAIEKLSLTKINDEFLDNYLI